MWRTCSHVACNIFTILREWKSERKKNIQFTPFNVLIKSLLVYLAIVSQAHLSFPVRFLCSYLYVDFYMAFCANKLTIKIAWLFLNLNIQFYNVCTVRHEFCSVEASVKRSCFHVVIQSFKLSWDWNKKRTKNLKIGTQ